MKDAGGIEAREGGDQRQVGFISISIIVAASGDCVVFAAAGRDGGHVQVAGDNGIEEGMLKAVRQGLGGVDEGFSLLDNLGGRGVHNAEILKDGEPGNILIKNVGILVGDRKEFGASSDSQCLSDECAEDWDVSEVAEAVGD